jgi:predicted Zn-dependent protease
MGRADEALADVETLIRRDPLDAEAHALRGLIQLAGGDPDAATAALRRALFAEPAFGAASFLLGRAHDAAGRPARARAAYARTLRTLGAEDDRDAALLGTLDPAEVLAACRSRLEGGGA